MKIGIDLGHECYPDTGAIGIVTEETIINKVGALVISKLRNLGHEVIELRPESANSVNDSLQKRYNKANNNNVDICVSIHANCGGGHGTEIFTFGAKDVYGASEILKKICAIGFTNRGIKDGKNLAMVRRPSALAMLIEICFCDSQSDVDLYSDNIENIANAIVEGLTGQVSNKYSIGWNQDDVGWFYSADGNDYYKSCWKQIKEDYYYFNDYGYADCNKWILENGKWYYLDDNCIMVQAKMPDYIKWKWINGDCYCFGTDGAIYQDCTTNDGYKVDKDGKWIRPF